jgi:hypothetical protein
MWIDRSGEAGLIGGTIGALGVDRLDRFGAETRSGLARFPTIGVARAVDLGLAVDFDFIASHSHDRIAAVTRSQIEVVQPSRLN